MACCSYDCLLLLVDFNEIHNTDFIIEPHNAKHYKCFAICAIYRLSNKLHYLLMHNNLRCRRMCTCVRTFVKG